MKASSFSSFASASEPVREMPGSMSADAAARALWLESGRACLRDEALPADPLGPREAIVRTTFSAVSRGTECLVYRGQVPESEYERMRAPHQQGNFPGPVKYGYCSVGVVQAGPRDWVGQCVFCLHPHQDRYRIDTQALHRIPSQVPAARAVLAANLETALNACWDLAPAIGDRIVVVGGGVVGLLVARLLARMPAVRVQVVDVEPSRAAIVQSFGADFALPDDAWHDADGVVHASGCPQGLATALRCAGMQATVLEMSWYGTKQVTVPLGEAFHARRLSIRASQVGTLPAVQQARWDHRRRMALVLALLDDALLDALISDECTFDELPLELHRLATEPCARTLCLRVRYPAHCTEAGPAPEPGDPHHVRRQRP